MDHDDDALLLGPLADRSVTVTFGAGSASMRSMLLAFGVPEVSVVPFPRPPVYSARFSAVEHVPTLAPAPVKRRGLTGKAYRAARRGHRRRARAWRRAGSPTVTVEHTYYLPQVEAWSL